MQGREKRKDKTRAEREKEESSRAAGAAGKPGVSAGKPKQGLLSRCEGFVRLGWLRRRGQAVEQQLLKVFGEVFKGLLLPGACKNPLDPQPLAHASEGIGESQALF